MGEGLSVEKRSKHQEVQGLEMRFPKVEVGEVYLRFDVNTTYQPFA
jgi:hypothetical protein